MEGKFIQHLAEQNIIPEREKEIYAFGMRQLKVYVIGIMTDIIIGILFGMILECLIFTVAYIPLRQYAGGYHAPNPKLCYVMSVMLVCAALTFIKYIELNAGVMVLCILASLVIILVKAPVESKNKPLSDKEKDVFKKYTRIISVIEVGMFSVLYHVGFEAASQCILAAISFSAILLLFSDELNKKHKHFRRL